MARLIDADALREEWLESGENEYVYDTNAVLYSIDSAPTIDVQPVRRGEWRYVSYQTDKTTWITGEFICRKCGKGVPRHMGDNPPDYCQHCGADMRKVSE